MPANNDTQFVIAHTFAAPPAQVFAMWTQPDDLARWLAPPGFVTHFQRADIRPGGDTLFSMAGAGVTMYASAHYEEVDSPQRLVYTQQFCDEHGAVARHPLAPTWPETMRVTVTLALDDAGRTRVTVTMDIAGDANPVEVATFVAGHTGMTMGWNAAFAQLDAVLAS